MAGHREAMNEPHERTPRWTDAEFVELKTKFEAHVDEAKSHREAEALWQETTTKKLDDLVDEKKYRVGAIRFIKMMAVIMSGAAAFWLWIVTNLHTLVDSLSKGK